MARRRLNVLRETRAGHGHVVEALAVYVLSQEGTKSYRREKTRLFSFRGDLSGGSVRKEKATGKSDWEWGGGLEKGEDQQESTGPKGKDREKKPHGGVA